MTDYLFNFAKALLIASVIAFIIGTFARWPGVVLATFVGMLVAAVLAFTALVIDLRRLSRQRMNQNQKGK